MGERQEGWLMFPDRIPRSWVASPGAEVFIVEKKGQEERGNRAAGCSRVAAAHTGHRSPFSLVFSTISHAFLLCSASITAPVLGSAKAGAAGRETSPATSVGTLVHDGSWQFTSRESRGGVGGWRTGGTTPAFSRQKVVLSPHVSRQGEWRMCFGARGGKWELVPPVAQGEAMAVCSSLSHAGRSSVKEKNVGKHAHTHTHTHTSRPIFTVQALSSVKARHVDLPLKLNWTPKT